MTIVRIRVIFPPQFSRATHLDGLEVDWPSPLPISPLCAGYPKLRVNYFVGSFFTHVEPSTRRIMPVFGEVSSRHLTLKSLHLCNYCRIPQLIKTCQVVLIEV